MMSSHSRKHAKRKKTRWHWLAVPAAAGAFLLSVTLPSSPAGPAVMMAASPPVHHVTRIMPGHKPVLHKTPGRVYTVRDGDTMWGIASRYCGSPVRWAALWKANVTAVPVPGQIRPGQVLKLEC